MCIYQLKREGGDVTISTHKQKANIIQKKNDLHYVEVEWTNTLTIRE